MKLPSLGRLPLLAVIASGFAAPLTAQVTSRVVAYSGLPAPGAPPAVFDGFNYLAVGPQGEIVLRGRLATGSNTYGLWRESFDPGTGNPVLGLVQREGTASPLPGFTFTGPPGPPTINLPGHFAFKAHVTNGSIFHDTLWVEEPAPAGLTLVAREGDPAPGAPGANFAAIFVHAGYDPLLLDDSGRALFVGRLTGGGVTAANDTGLWFYDGSTVSLVAREGEQMPGVPAGHFYGETFPVSNSALLGNGVFVFFAGDNHPTAPIRGLWSNHSGSVQPLILEGGSTPGLAGDEALTLLGGFRINNNNQVAFDGIIRKDDGINPVSLFHGVWISNAAGTFQLAARSDTAPGGRVPSVAAFTDGGHVFGVDAIGRLCRVTTSGLTVIARPTDPAPGTPAGVQFAAIDGAAIGASSAGQVAFEASLQGTGVHAGNDRGLWAQDDSFQLVKVGREGDTIEAPAGMPRTITNIEFALGVGSGQPRGMSDRGEVVWRAIVAGLPQASQVVAVSGVGAPPEPPRLVGLEVVQVIQDWRNDQPLVAGKKTIVRAHVTSFDPLKFVGRLRAFAGSPPGAELPGSPLEAANPGGYVNVDAISDRRRDQLGASSYFEVPDAWTTGTVTFRAEWASGGLLCRELAGPTIEDCEATVTFAAAQVPQVRFLSVDYLQGVPPAVEHLDVDLAADMAGRLISAFPIAQLSWNYATLGITFPSAPDTLNILELLPFIRTADGCTDAVGCKRLYYGAALGDRIDGIANRPGSVGSGYVPRGRTADGRHTHTHEFGHNLDRHHSVHSSVPHGPGEKKGSCGEVASAAAPDFPNWFQVNGVFKPTLGAMDQGNNELVYGLDTDLKEVVDPNKWFDLMSYCSSPPIDLWPSDFTYGNLLAAVNTRFAAPVFAGIASGNFFIVRGSVDFADGSVSLLPFGTLIQTPAPDPLPAGSYLLRLRSAGGALLQEISFEPDRWEGRGPDPNAGSFLIGVPANPTIRKVEILQGGLIVASRTATANAPTVQVISPNGGETLSGPTVGLQWTGSDVDGDPLTYVVQYSADNGTTWTTLAVDLAATNIQIPRASLPGSTQGRLRVYASDGFLTGFDVSNAVFTVANNPPSVSISDPDSGQLFVGDQLVFLDALSFDPEDGNLADPALSWSSNINGPLGTGDRFSRAAGTLTPGTHIITVTATDGGGLQATDTVTIRIATQATAPLVDLSVDVNDGTDPTTVGGSVTYTVRPENEGPDPATGVNVSFTANLDPDGPAGPGPASITSVVAPDWSCTTGTGTVNCSRAAFPAFLPSPITIQVSASQIGTLTASAQISGPQDDPATGNNTANETTGITPPMADLSVTKTHSPASPLVGHELTYTITARNNGPDAATGVTVSDTLPAQVTFVSAAASQGGCTGTSTISCNLGSLASGAQATVTIVVRPAAAGTISNTATVTSDDPDPTPGNNQATDVISMTGSNGPFAFHTVTPCRVLDTRLPDGPLGGPALGGAERSFVLAGTCGIPATAKAVSANITVTGPASQGHLSLYPGGFGLPLVSSINFRASQTRANNATLPLGTGGAISVQAALIEGTVHFILDVNGYYE